MENHNLTIKKETLEDSLRKTTYRGLKDISPEKFSSDMNHPLYSAFTHYFAQRIKESDLSNFDAFDYTQAFQDAIKDKIIENIDHKKRIRSLPYEKQIDEIKKIYLTPGRLHKIHDYFDALVETISHNIFGDDYGKLFSDKAKEIYSNSPDLFSHYFDKEENNEEVA